ncbi:MAG: MFS transporter [Opitutales bacterium]|nr:MFS transporter [Opitutales bacterium]
MSKKGEASAPSSNQAFTDLIFNLLIPILILKKGDEWLPLSSTAVLVLALAFPIGFGLKDLIVAKRVNIFSILGLVNVLLTGVIGLLELPPKWIAVKEAAIPAIIGLIVVISMWTPYPLVKTLLYNPKILKVDLIDEKLEASGKKNQFDLTLKRSTWLLGGSFLVSSILNYTLARIMVKTHPAVNKELFNQEISGMWAWSMVVIVIPSMIVMILALWTIIRGIRIHAGLTMEEVMVGLKED